MMVGVKVEEAAKPVTTVGHLKHFLCETAGYLSGHLRTISSLVYGNKKTQIFLTEARTSPAVFAPIKTPAEQRRVRNTSSSTDPH